MSDEHYDRLVATRLVWLVGFLVVMIGAANPVRAGSIFDDDFQPPPIAPRVTPPPPPVPSAPAPAHPEPAAPTPPSTAPAPDSTSPPPAPESEPPKVAEAPSAPARREVPSKADRTTSRTMLKQVYVKELADKTPPARKALAGKFIEDAEKSSNAPADEFVLLSGAIQAAQEASDLPLSFQAVDAMARDFSVEASALKAQSLLKLSSRQLASNHAENLRVGLALMDELEGAGDYVQAEKVGTALEQSGNDLDRARIDRRVKAVHEKAAAQKRLAAALAVLKTSPNDPASNSAAGRYYCFMQDDWEHGLPMLAKGSDAAMKSLATKDVAAAKSADKGALAAGDAWWEASEREASAASKTAMQKRAAFWYQQVLPTASGLAKVRIEKRIQSIPQPAAPGTDTPTTPESDAVLSEMVAQFPDALKIAPDLRLVHSLDGMALRGAYNFISRTPGSFSQMARTTDIDFDATNPFVSNPEPLSAGKYFIVFRVQGFPQFNPFVGNNVTVLDVCHQGGNSIASNHLRGADIRAGQWLSFAVSIDLKADDTVQYKFWANNHKIDLDRIYVFKLK